MTTATCTHFIDREARKVLLAYQVRKIVGLKGYGGKIEPHQTPESNAIDEVKEESGGDPAERINPAEEGGIQFSASALKRVGLIDFYNGTEEEAPFGSPTFRVVFFNCYEYSGSAISTNQMQRPDWYDIDNLPIGELIVGDELFLLNILNENMLTGWMRRTSDFKTILGYHFEPCTAKALVI
ncbi:MAG: hypothetical protein V4478_03645 [Patescibacteria group bacterium]